MSEINTIDILGDDIAVRKLIDKSIEGPFVDDTINSIGAYVFIGCSLLSSASFPKVKTMGAYAFSGCINLAAVSLPALETIGDYSFNNCPLLTTVSFPVASYIGLGMFNSCSHLVSASFMAATIVGDRAFYNCPNLTTVILGNTAKAATLNNARAFTNADNAIIYVPDELVDSYKAATNWSTYADRIKGISELPEE